MFIIINNNNKLYLYSTFHAKECSSKCFTANTLRAQGAGAGFLLAILLCLARVGYKQCMLYCEGGPLRIPGTALQRVLPATLTMLVELKSPCTKPANITKHNSS